MRPLDAKSLLSVWDVGQKQHPLDRALSILGAALPDTSRDALARLPIGRRDALLIRLRERTFGPVLDGFVECAHCGEQLEISVPAASLAGGSRAGDDTLSDNEPRGVEHGGYRISFRLPTSLDLAVVARGPSERIAAAIIDRVVLAVDREGESISPGELPDDAIEALGEHVAQMDPTADIVFAPTCPACGEASSVPFDIGSFLWSEIRFHARRLLAEVHQLASAYGWREADILDLSEARRRAYLEMLGV